MTDAEKIVWATAYVQFASTVTFPPDLSLPGREAEFARWESERTRNGIEYAASMVDALRQASWPRGAVSPGALTMLHEVIG